MKSLPVWISRVLLAAAALFAGLYAARPITTWDFWWHVRTGEEIVRERALPDVDPFSHTAGSVPWINHEWLFDVILYPVWAHLGGYPIRIACGLITVATLLLVIWIAWRWTKSPGLTALLTLAFLGLYFGNIQIRPQILSYPFFLWIIDRYFFRKDRPAWPLLAGTAALMIFWANIHAVALLPVIFYVAYLTAESLSPWLSRYVPILAAPPGDRLPWKSHLPAFGVIFACTFIGPNTWHLYEYALKGSAVASTFVGEWAPFYFRYELNRNLPFVIYSTVIASLAIYLASLAAHAWERKRLDGAEVAIATTTFYFVLTGRRWLWIAVVPLFFALRAGAPLRDLLARIASAARPAGRRKESKKRKKRAKAAAAPSAAQGGGAWRPAVSAAGTLALGAVLLSPFAEFRPVHQAWDTLRTGKYFHLYTNPVLVPSAAVNVMREAGLKGNLFNFYGWGGYLLYTLYPDCRDFIDGRAVLFPERVIADSVAITQRTPEAQALLDRYKVDLTVMPRSWEPPLGGSVPWVLFFRDATEAVFGRAGSENLSRIAAYYKRLGIEFGPPNGFVEASAVEGNPEWAAKHEILQPAVMAIAGPLYHKLHEGRVETPAERSAIRERIAETYIKSGLGLSAAQELRKAYKLDPSNKFAVLNLANIEMRLGRPEEARRVLSEYAAAYPDDDQVRSMLGQAGGPLPPPSH